MAQNVRIDIRHGDITAAGAPLTVVNLFEGVTEPSGATKAVDAATGGAVGRALRAGGFAGKRGECLVVYPEQGPERVLVIGLGKKDDFDGQAAREVAGVMARQIRALKVKSAATVLHGGESGMNAADLARALAEGFLLAHYRYTEWFRDGREESPDFDGLTVVEAKKPRVAQIEKGVALGRNVADSMNLTRDLVNGPGNQVTPTYIANTAQRLGKEHGLKVTVLDRDACAKLGMGGFLAVAQGSHEPCKFIVLEYRPPGAKGTVCFVGKGITFDTGGISLKPAPEMDLMKYDMGGSGAVLGGLNFAAAHQVPLNVIGIIASTENMPGGSAYKPGDIITASNGVTIEIKNTDAEGRMVLSDALVYAERFKPDAVVDLATLTGACVIALGQGAAAMGNDEWLLDRVTAAADASGERVWPMPLWQEYREKVKSSVADIKNSAGREAGSLTAGAFLGTFTDNYPWVHLDIAGAAWNDKPARYMDEGAAGGGVRTLCQLLIDWKKRPGPAAPKPGPRTSLRGIVPSKPKAAATAAPKSAPKTARKPARKGR